LDQTKLPTTVTEHTITQGSCCRWCNNYSTVHKCRLL